MHSLRYCRNCGAGISPDDSFCGSCGARIVPVEDDRAGESATRESRLGARSRAYPRLWSEEPVREAVSGLLLGMGVVFLLLAAIYLVLVIRWSFGASQAPGIEGLVAFVLLHGGAVSVEAPPIPALLGIGGSATLGPPATSFVLLPFLALLSGSWAVTRRIAGTSWLFVAVTAVSYAILLIILAALGSAALDLGGGREPVEVSAEPVSSGLRSLLWAGLGTTLGVSAARGPLLPDQTRQVIKGALVAVASSAALALALALIISLTGQGPDAPAQGIGEDLGGTFRRPAPADTGGVLSGIGALFALIPVGIGSVWLLSHGLPVGFQNVPDLSAVPLIGEALRDVPFRVSLLGEWPLGNAWRLLLIAPIVGIVLGGIVASRGAASRPAQGAMIAVPYTVIVVLAAVLTGLSASLSVAALNVDVTFGASVAWALLLLPVTAALGAAGGLLGRSREIGTARPMRTMVATGTVGGAVLLLSLPVALAPLSGGSTAPPDARAGDPPIGDIGPEPTVSPGQEDTPPEPDTDESESSEPADVSADAAPDPAFGALLPTLEGMTTAPIMLPAELPEEFSNIAIDSATGGDEYGILFLGRPTGNVLESYVRANDVGTIRSSPNPQEVSEEFFDSTREETVELPDGTPATLRYLEPVGMSNAAPFWEGRFEKDGQTYIVNIPMMSPNGDLARGLLTSMVEVPRATDEVSVEQQFISEYYAAVGRRDWSATYSMLDSATQRLFTEEEWSLTQEARENASGAAPVTATTIMEISGEGANFTATVNLAYEDGTEASIPGIVVYFEDGEFKRHLTDEELAFLEGF